MTTGESLRLLIVEESGSDAESLATEFRNAGHTLAFDHVASGDALAAALEQQLPDIVICGSGDGLPDLQEIGSILERCPTPPAVIAIADAASEADVISARKSGIDELVSYERPEHLHMVFERQMETIRLRHSLQRLEKKLQDGETRCNELIENSSDAIAYIHDGMHVYANRPYMKLFAIETREEIEGMPVLDMISSEQRDTFKEFLKTDFENDDDSRMLDIECLSPHEGKFNCTMECSPATMAGEPCTQLLIRVHTSSSELEERINSLSNKDMLTGLSNRQHFMTLLAQRIAHPVSNRKRALIYVMLDNFKSVRDEAGIAASDAVLCDMASLISKQCGDEDTLSRFGDFSFAILKQASDQDAIQRAGEELLNTIGHHLSEAGGRAFTLTASIGICAINEHAQDIQKIISYADMACEVARTSGGNQIHTHSTIVDDSISNEQKSDLDWIISDTIEQERFYLVYQPIVSLKGDTSPRYEVLLRILDEQDHTILPGEFLAIADKTGLSGKIDRWIIDHAFATLAELRKNSTTSFYIKLSGSTLTDNDLAEWISDRLLEYGLDSEGVVFEIPEQVAELDLTHTMSFVEAVHSINCKVALEHIGRNGKVQILNHVPADIIKIDSSLIARLTSDKEAQDTVRAVIEIAKKSGKPCIAENVEDSSCLAKLWQLGIHYIQGNFIQEPSRELGYTFESEVA